MARFLLLFLALAASPAQAEVATSVFLAEHRYALDHSGTLGVADLEKSPEIFRPLPAWWQRDPPGVVRWERLTLQWRGNPDLNVVDPVLHFRAVLGTRLTILYPPEPAHCGALAPRTVPDGTTSFTVSRWTSIPLCPGANQVYIRFVTTRNVGPIVEVTSRVDASVMDFSTSSRSYILGGLALSGLVLGLVGVLRTRDPLWMGLMARVMLASPYFMAHSAIPRSAPLGPLLTPIRRLPPDFLIATAVLGTTLFVVGALWESVRQERRRRALLVLPVLACFAVVAAVAAPYPWGNHLALLTAMLSVPITLIVIWWRNEARTDAEPHHSLHHWERVALSVMVALALIGSIFTFAFRHWEVLPFLVAAMYAALGMRVAIGTSIRRELASAAIFAERLSRQRADDHAREQEERRLEHRDLILMLTHEIRTPLSVVRLSLDQVGRSESARTRAHGAIVEMDRLIERCLETARLDTETTEDAVAGWTARASLLEVISRARTPERVHLRVDDEAVLPRTNPAVIDSIVSILIDNALRYGAPEAEVVVEATTRDVAENRRIVRVAVINAIGPFGAPDGERVFRKYYRGTGAHRQSGAGLGLYLAARLAERLGGGLSHASNGELTRFELWIPH